jgi:hypothetical protein
MQQAQIQMLNQWRAQLQQGAHANNGVGRPPNMSLRPTLNVPRQNGGGVLRPPTMVGGMPMPTMMRANPAMLRPPISYMREDGGIGVNRATPISSGNNRPPLPQRPSLLKGMSPSLHHPSTLTDVSNMRIFKEFDSVAPYRADMTEGEFLESLSKFLELSELPLRKVPEFNNRPMQMHHLYKIVTSFGGYHKLTEIGRWSAVVASFDFLPKTPDLLASLRKVYSTMLLAYEQVFFHQRPLDKVDCKLCKSVDD